MQNTEIMVTDTEVVVTDTEMVNTETEVVNDETNIQENNTEMPTETESVIPYETTVDYTHVLSSISFWTMMIFFILLIQYTESKLKRAFNGIRRSGGK